jgi:hypothetical protein
MQMRQWRIQGDGPLLFKKIFRFFLAKTNLHYLEWPQKLTNFSHPSKDVGVSMDERSTKYIHAR